MERPRHWVRLHDILTCIGEIREATAGVTFEAFRSSWVLQRALERGVEIISEASRHVPDEAKARCSTIPWPDVRAIGNHLRHGYERVDLDVIWKVATEDLAELEPVARAMLAEIESS
jgi:uncharacterized protein with HEPN domain